MALAPDLAVLTASTTVSEPSDSISACGVCGTVAAHAVQAVPGDHWPDDRKYH